MHEKRVLKMYRPANLAFHHRPNDVRVRGRCTAFCGGGVLKKKYTRTERTFSDSKGIRSKLKSVCKRLHACRGVVDSNFRNKRPTDRHSTQTLYLYVRVQMCLPYKIYYLGTVKLNP